MRWKKRRSRAGPWTALALLGFALSPAYAAQGNPADISVTVTVSQMEITATNKADGTDTLALGTKLAGSNSVASSAITVTNSGNVTETFAVSIPSEPNGTWSSITSGSPGSEQYKLSGVFRANSAAAPATGDFEDTGDAFAVGTSKTANGADVLAVAADSGGAGTKGYQMATGTGNVHLWLKFHAPSTTAITTQQTIVVRITASTP